MQTRRKERIQRKVRKERRKRRQTRVEKEIEGAQSKNHISFITLFYIIHAQAEKLQLVLSS